MYPIVGGSTNNAEFKEVRNPEEPHRWKFYKKILRPPCFLEFARIRTDSRLVVSSCRLSLDWSLISLKGRASNCGEVIFRGVNPLEDLI